jgi:hypothetical protein
MQLGFGQAQDFRRAILARRHAPDGARRRFEACNAGVLDGPDLLRAE